MNKISIINQVSINKAVNREKDFYDCFWEKTKVNAVTSKLQIPVISSLFGKKVLICSCGTGGVVVQAANAGAKTYAFDISETAAKKAKEFAQFNGVTARIDVMDFHNLLYDDNFFDVIYGSAILHHVDCSIVGKEIYRCLKPEGIAYFFENSDRNAILRLCRRLLFGKPGGVQKEKFLFIKRRGTTDEYPLTEEEIKILTDIFKGNLERIYRDFYFFQLISYLIFKSKKIGNFLRNVDNAIVKVIPFIGRYSFSQEIILRKT